MKNTPRRKVVEIKHPCLNYIGHEAIFYVPRYKLTTQIGGKLVKDLIHEFLSVNYKAYTLGDSTITGFWIGGEKMQDVFEDKNVEYRVAFLGRQRVLHFIDFLSKLCRDMNEIALYLRMGKKSYIVYAHPVESKQLTEVGS